MNNQSVTWLEDTLWPRGERRDIWMIVDAARDRRIFGMLLECRLQYSCLYSGFLPPRLEIAAPYLVQLEYQDGYARRILDRAWGNSWGVFLKCDLRLEQLRRHLRHFLIARDALGGRLVFRYYDPRVLPVYLPTCLDDELRTFFGPIECFWTENQAPEGLLELRIERGGLVRRKLALAAGKAPDRRVPDKPFEITFPERYKSLTIRPSQAAAFSQMEVRKFEAWVLAHLKKFFPAQSASAGDREMEAMVHYGIQRAAAHGITAKRDVCKYIDLMVVFGRDFDTDARHPWAARILGQEAKSLTRMQRLLSAAKARLGNR
jgi:hypothetical protein